jgi:hypothetical protein
MPQDRQTARRRQRQRMRQLLQPSGLRFNMSGIRFSWPTEGASSGRPMAAPRRFGDTSRAGNNRHDSRPQASDIDKSRDGLPHNWAVKGHINGRDHRNLLGKQAPFSVEPIGFRRFNFRFRGCEFISINYFALARCLVLSLGQQPSTMPDSEKPLSCMKDRRWNVSFSFVLRI